MFWWNNGLSGDPASDHATLNWSSTAFGSEPVRAVCFHREVEDWLQGAVTSLGLRKKGRPAMAEPEHLEDDPGMPWLNRCLRLAFPNPNGAYVSYDHGQVGDLTQRAEAFCVTPTALLLATMRVERHMGQVLGGPNG
jgi:hypothetical protein